MFHRQRLIGIQLRCSPEATDDTADEDFIFGETTLLQAVDLASFSTLWMAPHQLQLSLSSFWDQKRRVEHFTISSLLCPMI